MTFQAAFRPLSFGFLRRLEPEPYQNYTTQVTIHYIIGFLPLVGLEGLFDFQIAREKLPNQKAILYLLV